MALVAEPVGCFVVWRRMAYFGETLAHAVLLGITLGFLLRVEPILAILLTCLLLAACLTLLERQRLVPLDTLLGVAVNEDLAAVEGVPVERVRTLLVLLLAVVIAVGMKIVGVLLVLALVIIPAAAVRRIVGTPEQMVFAATASGGVSVAAGLFGSMQRDIPAGPAIVLVASATFIASLLVPARGRHGPGE